MFKNKLYYYHGTTKSIWETICATKIIKPNRIKSIGNYWITKGAYFVCENPYIALWYAHFACFHEKNKNNNNSEPVVIKLGYEADKLARGEIINLLTSDGHKLLAIAHNNFKAKLSTDEVNYKDNIDSHVLHSLLEKSKTAKGIIAAFHEGESFQKLIHNKEYTNRHVSHKGICPGDHVEICFYPELVIDDKLEIDICLKDDIIKEDKINYPIWPIVCQSLTNVLTNEELRRKFTDYIKLEYPEF